MPQRTSTGCVFSSQHEQTFSNMLVTYCNLTTLLNFLPNSIKSYSIWYMTVCTVQLLHCINMCQAELEKQIKVNEYKY